MPPSAESGGRLALSRFPSPRSVMVRPMGSPTRTTVRSAATSMEKPLPTAPAKLAGRPSSGNGWTTSFCGSPLARTSSVLAGRRRSPIKSRNREPPKPESSRSPNGERLRAHSVALRTVTVIGARGNSPARSGISVRVAVTTVKRFPSNSSSRASAAKARSPSLVSIGSREDPREAAGRERSETGRTTASRSAA